jgi:branched-chain amino acid transport system ATP-binding protein
LNCISGITRPAAGCVRLDDRVLSATSAVNVARQGIGRVFQHPELVVDLSVHENLMIAGHQLLDYSLMSELFMLPKVRRQERDAAKRVAGVLERLGLAESADATVRSLPYGHRKLIDLGRALMMNVRFLLLDEPIAGLNDAEIDRLTKLLLALRGEMHLGLVVVEHNMTFVSRLCDRLVVLDLGELIADGPPAEVLRDARVMSSYLGEAADA